jgi:hypothetical protein
LKDNFGMMDLDFKRIEKLFNSVTRDHIVEMMKIKEDKADLAESLAFLQKQIDELSEKIKDEVTARESLAVLTNQLIKKIDSQSENL